MGEKFPLKQADGIILKMANKKINQIKKVLTIAGSDSGGGAGIQADLKTFAALGVYGTSAVTAITAQNTIGVQGILEVKEEFIAKQIDSVMRDIGADAWKIGMLANKKIIDVVAKKAAKYKIRLVVLDPVMLSKNGSFLLKKKALETLINKLFPLSFVVTPNLNETKIITGKSIKTIKQMKEAAFLIKQMGPQNVLIKGGHLVKNSDAVDILYNGREFTEFRAKRIKTKNDHGTGCTFSSAIAAELAKGHSLNNAIAKAKNYVTNALELAKNLDLGNGHGPLDHMLGRY